MRQHLVERELLEVGDRSRHQHRVGSTVVARIGSIGAPEANFVAPDEVLAWPKTFEVRPWLERRAVFGYGGSRHANRARTHPRCRGTATEHARVRAGGFH